MFNAYIHVVCALMILKQYYIHWDSLKHKCTIHSIYTSHSKWKIANRVSSFLCHLIFYLSCIVYKKAITYSRSIFSYFQGIPEKNPSQRHIYSTSDKWGKESGPPKCISCDLQLQYNCTFNNAIFSPK